MSGLGARLKELRTARKLTQEAVAKELGGLSRAVVAQWESGRHLPSADNIAKLDQLYGAMGGLVAHAANIRAGVEQPEVRRTRDLREVFSKVADALVRAIRTDGEFVGWSHNLLEGRPTALSSAYVVRTLQLLDDARVDLHVVGRSILSRRNEEGTWSNRAALTSRPEATAVILAALARMGMLTDIAQSLERLGEGLKDEYNRSRPFILSVMLEAVLRIDPGHKLVEDLVKALLASRTEIPGSGLLWAHTTVTKERAYLLQPSLPHTARAVALLRTVPNADDEVRRAVDDAVAWILQLTGNDEGTVETVDPAPDVPGATIVLNHFSAPWCVRALLGLNQVPAHRIARSLDEVWHNFDGTGESLWCWRADTAFPSWMTLDAVTALRQAALTSFPAPLEQLETHGAHAPHAGGR